MESRSRRTCHPEGDPEAPLREGTETSLELGSVSRGGDLDALWEEGIARFGEGEFAAARAALERAATADPRPDPEGLFMLGAALERAGRLAQADAALARAAALAPDEYVVPYRVDDAAFDAAVTEALEALPAPLQTALDRDATLIRDDYPSAAAVAAGQDPFLLGECLGELELTRLGEAGPVEVYLYRRNLEKVSDTRGRLVEEIRVTLYHELGHALGLDEGGVEALGLA